MDINADRLAVTETDRFGNPVGSWVIPCVTYGRTSERRVAIVGDAVKQVVAIAMDRRKPMAIEKLDFWKKRATLEAESGKHARMLSAFAYWRIPKRREDMPNPRYSLGRNGLETEAPTRP